MRTMTTRTVEYSADGLTMLGHLALPAGAGRRPAVLLGPEGMGLSDVERRRADALAELGYVALAFDLHGGRYLADPEEMRARCLPLLADPDRMRDIGHAALDVLRAEPRTDPDLVAAVGYGTGGAVALELGRDGVGLRAIGTVNALTTGRPGEAARIRCPVWAGVGSEDPIMSPAQRNAFTAEMQAAGVDWRLTVYGGALHAFHHPPVGHPTVPGVGYHPRHARRAWRDVLDLLAECLPMSQNPALSNLPGIVVICGSTRFMTEMNEADLRETKAGRIVVKPSCDTKSPHELGSDPAEAEALEVRLGDLHRSKIRLADEVLVVGDYVGDSTRAEIAYARSLGKPVRFTHPEVDPDA